MFSKLPSKNQWRQFFSALSRKEKLIFSFLLTLFLASFSFVSANFYLKNTKIVPADGGKYTEGILGQPRFINPVYAPAFDTDRDISEILFAGIMKYSPEGKIV